MRFRIRDFLQKKKKGKMTIAKGEKVIMREEPGGAFRIREDRLEKERYGAITFIDPVTGKEYSRVAYRIDEKKSGPKPGYISWVYTEEKFRGEKLASLLLDKVLSKLEEEGAHYVMLRFSPLEGSKETAERLYRKKGFVPVSELPKETAIKLLGKEEYEKIMKIKPDEVFVKVL